MNRIERITYYENIMKDAVKTLEKYESALAEFKAVQGRIKELDAYLQSKAWKSDFAAFEQGKLPVDLPCGVLSEDGIFNLLELNSELLESGAEMCKNG